MKSKNLPENSLEQLAAITKDKAEEDIRRIRRMMDVLSF
jgi:hypothetical protein